MIGRGWQRLTGRIDVLELYPRITSVCAQKARIALEAKRQQPKDHIMTLRGDQHEPGYLRLDRNGVVPTLIHGGLSSSITSTAPSRSRANAKEAAGAAPRTRIQQLIDEYLHNSCMIRRIPPGRKWRAKHGRPRLPSPRSSAVWSTKPSVIERGLIGWRRILIACIL
jgi:hypothetical protein